MKKMLLVLTAALLVLTACGPEPAPTDPETTAPVETTVPTETTAPVETTAETQPDVQIWDASAYDALLSQYYQAVSEQWGGGKLMDANMNYMLSDCYYFDAAPLDCLGYAIRDLDGDGVPELMIASTGAITDEFYGKLVFDMYTLDEEGKPCKVFYSAERNRYYYAGDALFANMGSSGAAETNDVTLRYRSGVMEDLGYPTPPASYIQPELIPFSQYNS